MGRKAKPVAASSSKALEVCGDTSRLGISAADVFAQFSAPTTFATHEDDSSSAMGTSQDPEIALVLHAMQKKDPTTRLRGVAEMQQLFAARNAESLRDAAPAFVNIYRKLWPQDAEPRVREGMQRSLQVLVESLQRDFARHFRSVFPTWLCAMYDTHPEVAQAARKALEVSFEDKEKRRNAFRRCKAECLELLTANLQHSEQTLHDSLGIANNTSGDRNVALERQDRYARVIAASLSALGELVTVCSTPAVDSAKQSSADATIITPEDVEPFFRQGSQCALWLRLASKQPPLVRRAAATCLAQVLQCPSASASACEASQTRSSVISALTDEAVQPVLAVVLFCRYVAAAGDASWQGLNASKALWPQIIASLRRGLADEAFLVRFCELLQCLPADAWVAGRCESLLQVLLEGLEKPRALVPKAVWHCYFSILRVAGDRSVAVSSLWRWAPVQLYLCSRVSRESCVVEGTLESLPTDGESPDPSSNLPKSSLPMAACSALPGALKTELPKLLASKDAGNELLDSLAEWAPPVDAARLKEGTLSQAWANWISVFVQLLATTCLHEDLHSKVTSVLSKEFQRLLAVALHAPVETIATDGAQLLKSVGTFFLPELKPDASWVPRDNDDLAQCLASEQSCHIEADDTHLSFPELALISWPILPWWRKLLRSDSSCEAALALSNYVLQPLLSSVLKRDDDKKMRHPIRDMVAHALIELPAWEDLSCLARAVRLVSESLPKEMDVAASATFRNSVKRVAKCVAESVSAGNLQKDELTAGSAAVVALQLALKPGGSSLPSDDVHEVIELLVHALQDAISDEGRSSCAFRLACLIGSILNGNGDVSNGLNASRSQVLDFIIKRLLIESRVQDGDASAWALLPGLFRGGDLSTISKALGPVPMGKAMRQIWIRIATEAISATEVHPARFLSMCRSGSADFELDGCTTLEKLRCHALATARLIEVKVDAWLSSNILGTDVSAAFYSLWEVLLANVVVPQDSVLKQTSATIWSWIHDSDVSLRRDFLRFCVGRAADEGLAWRLVSSEELAPCKLTMCNSGYSLTVLRDALERLWTSEADVCSMGAGELVEWVLSGISDVSGDAPNWGRAVALVFSRLKTLHVSKVESSCSTLCAAAVVRHSVRQALSGAGSSQQLSAPLLHMATAVELWSSETLEAKVVKITTPGNAVDEGPIIAEVDSVAIDAKPQAVETEVVEELDTRLIETHERLLRWTQGSSRTIDDRDAFAAYTAAAWPSIAGTTPDMSMSSRTITRMHRFLLELLADCQKNADCKISPGAFRLIVALAETSAWPDSSWTIVLQAVVEVDKLIAEKLRIGRFSDECYDEDAIGDRGLLTASVFIDDAVTAASATLQHVPNAHILSMVPFLAAAEIRLQTSVARRLRKHQWIPRHRENMPEADKKVLDQFEAAVREEIDGNSDQPAKNIPDCCDIIYAVVVAGIGSELAKECWAVEEALASFNDWESQTDLEGNVCDEHVDRSSPTIAEAEQLPADCQRRCVGVLSAWELVLTGLQTQQPSSSSKDKNVAENVAPSSASELVASALQLTPDQIAGTQTSPGWPSLSSPELVEGHSPLQPLVQLLFHIITCERLAGRRGCEAVLQQVLAHALAAGELMQSNDFNVFGLAARVLFLMLKAMPAAARSFWERLPRRRDRDLVERLIAKVYSPGLVQAETQAAISLLESQKDQFPEAEASVVRRQRQIVLQLARDEVNAELTVQVPDSFPLRMATAEIPEKLPGIPKQRFRNWMLQSRQVLAGPHPMGVARSMVMWSRSFALFFEGVEDCPICYCLVHITTQTIPRKACPTCKHKFHNECLYHWFKTSNKSTCPLCNQPF